MGIKIMYSKSSERWLKESLDKMTRLIPVFPATAENIQILHEPNEFYNELLKGIETAQERIILTSLYIGSREQELVQALRKALSDPNKKNLRVYILLDFLRGTRGSDNSVTLLTPILRDFPGRVQLSLYHTPNLRGVVKKLVPSRLNEGFGIQHIKCYSFDNNVILSGANLNRDYFTNRQDRYIQFLNHKLLSSYFYDLVSTISGFSYTFSLNGVIPKSLKSSSTIALPSMSKSDTYQNFEPPLQKNIVHSLEAFCEKWNKHSCHLKANLFENQINDQRTSYDTFVSPAIQMGIYGMRQDQLSLEKLLLLLNEKEGEPFQVHWCSGYLNFPKEYTELVWKSSSQFQILTASPEANGFYKSKGISRHVPAAYTFLEQLFLRQAKYHQKEDEIKLFEFQRKGWTWHGKGIWIQCPESKLPLVTTIGSSNFGKRSLERDLEAQVSIWTLNQNLSERMNKNLEFLYQDAQPVTLDQLNRGPRRVHPMVKIATRAIRSML